MLDHANGAQAPIALTRPSCWNGRVGTASNPLIAFAAVSLAISPLIAHLSPLH